MNGIALQIHEDVAGTDYYYEIVTADDSDDGGYKVWVSTGVLTGKFIGGVFAEFIDALHFLLEFLDDGEYLP